MNNFKMQKVLHLDKALALKTPKIHGDYILTEKFEGWFTTIWYDGTKFHNPLSSAGREIPAFSWVAERLNNQRIKHSKPFILIAEAYLEDTPFEILNGIFNRSKGDCHCHDVVFKLHDAVPMDIAMTADDRLLFTQQALGAIGAAYIHYVKPLYIGEYSADIWNKYFEEIAGNGGEGVVGKRAASFYQQGKRNADLLKLKLECTIDALADRVEEGFGDKGNKSYTLVSVRKNGTEIRTVLSRHSDQADIANILGKVVQLKAMQEYEDGNLRQAVFQYIRYDKLASEID